MVEVLHPVTGEKLHLEAPLAKICSNSLNALDAVEGQQLIHALHCPGSGEHPILIPFQRLDVDHKRLLYGKIA